VTTITSQYDSQTQVSPTWLLTAAVPIEDWLSFRVSLPPLSCQQGASWTMRITTKLLGRPLASSQHSRTTHKPLSKTMSGSGRSASSRQLIQGMSLNSEWSQKLWHWPCGYFLRSTIQYILLFPQNKLYYLKPLSSEIIIIASRLICSFEVCPN
jgi:hypothetical protein